LQGYIDIRQKKGKGTSNGGQPVFTFVENGENNDRLRREYFRPELKIAHHVGPHHYKKSWDAQTY